MFQGKKILLGVTGSIAAYKSLLLVRLLIKEGATVKVIMTPAAGDFVTALSLATLSRNPVGTALFDEDTWANHVELGRWADLMIIAPLSCNTLAKMAHGLCDNLLLATWLSAVCPVIVAPAMDEDMWRHPATRANLECIRSFGNGIIPVEKGELASGLYGDGRMAEPETILLFMRDHFMSPPSAGSSSLPVNSTSPSIGSASPSGNGTSPSGNASPSGNNISPQANPPAAAPQLASVNPAYIPHSIPGTSSRLNDLAGKKALVTAGPTYEALDPVRFIGNHSSGKMGIAIARELAERGALVDLVLGPSSMEAVIPGVHVRRVVSADEMFGACMEAFPSVDIAVMSAAVADYAPAVQAAEKIKKKGSELTLQLVKTKDILKTLGSHKRQGQVLVGFALENTSEREYALEKLKTKNADLIVLNSLNDPGAGFGFDTNRVTIFSRDGQEYTYDRKPKQQVAVDIVDKVVKMLYA